MFASFTESAQGDGFNDRGARPRNRMQSDAGYHNDVFSPTDEAIQDVERGAETTKLGLMFQSKNLNERVSIISD